MWGGPLIEAVARIDGVGTGTALAVISEVDEGELGIRARELFDKLSKDGGDALPSWVSELGAAVVTAAAVMREDVFDDARTVFLEARHPTGESHAVGVLIDNVLGGMAKDGLLADSIDRVDEVLRQHPPRTDDVKLQRIPPGIAAGLIQAALEETDVTWDPPVGEGYGELRAVALQRTDQTPGCVTARPRRQMPIAKRDRLLTVPLLTRGSELQPRQRGGVRRAAGHQLLRRLRLTDGRSA